MRAGLEPSTRSIYARAWAKFASFAVRYNISSFPAAASTIALYISHLVDSEGLSPTSIASALSAISYEHKLRDGGVPTSHFIVKKILAGLNKTSGTDVRVPISLSTLSTLLGTVGRIVPSPYERALVKAMYSLMFHGFLRIGEATDSPHNLRFQDVHIDQDSLSVTFHTFKHSAGKPCTVHISATRSESCPLILLSEYIHFRGTSPGFLFCFCDGRPVSAARFRHFLAASLTFAGLSHLKITPHSFRIGAATMAAIRYVPQSSIQSMGRWKSNAFTKYIRIASFSNH